MNILNSISENLNSVASFVANAQIPPASLLINRGSQAALSILQSIHRTPALSRISGTAVAGLGLVAFAFRVIVTLTPPVLPTPASFLVIRNPDKTHILAEEI